MPMDWNTIINAQRRDPELSREGTEAVRDAFSYVTPTSPEEAALSMMLGPFGKLGKVAGAAALSAAYSPDAEAGWLMGLKGAKKAGLDEIVRMLTEEKKAAKKLSNEHTPIVQASDQSGVWTGFGGEPRTFIPNTINTRLKVPLKRDYYKIPELLDVPDEVLSAYPQQFKRTTVFGVNDVPFEGQSVNNGYQIDINRQGMSPYKTLVHEITHAIPQEVEKFTGGSNLGVAARHIQNYRDMNARYNKAYSAGDVPKDVMKTWLEAIRKNPAHEFNMNSLGYSPRQLYLANEGEVEARMMADMFVDRAGLSSLAKYLPSKFDQRLIWNIKPDDPIFSKDYGYAKGGLVKSAGKWFDELVDYIKNRRTHDEGQIERVERMLKDMPHTSQVYSPEAVGEAFAFAPKEEMVGMRPDQFLRLAHPLPENQARPYVDTYKDLLLTRKFNPKPGLFNQHYIDRMQAKEFKGFDDVPFLQMERGQFPRQVTGHEGRHRNMVLRELFGPDTPQLTRMRGLNPETYRVYAEHDPMGEFPVRLRTDMERYKKGGLVQAQCATKCDCVRCRGK